MNLRDLNRQKLFGQVSNYTSALLNRLQHNLLFPLKGGCL